MFLLTHILFAFPRRSLTHSTVGRKIHTYMIIYIQQLNETMRNRKNTRLIKCLLYIRPPPHFLFSLSPFSMSSPLSAFFEPFIYHLFIQYWTTYPILPLHLRFPLHALLSFSDWVLHRQTSFFHPFLRQPQGSVAFT